MSIDTDALIDAVDRFLHDCPDDSFVDREKWEKWTHLFHKLIYVDGKRGPAEARQRMRERGQKTP